MLKLVFSNKKFGKLLTSSLISQLGSFFTYMLLIVISFDHSKSMLATMGVTGASSIGSMIAGSFAGVFVDRRSPIRVMVISYLCSAITISSLFWLPANVYFYYGAAFLIAVFNAFSNPAFSKYQVMIVTREELTNSNASIQVLREIIKIVGPGLAVFTLGLLPTGLKPVGFLIDATSYALAALLFLGERMENSNERKEIANSSEEKKSFAKNWAEGMQPLKNPIVSNVLVLYLFIILGIAGADVILTAHVSSSGYSTLQVGYVIASLSAGLIVASLIGPKYFQKWSLSLRLGGSAVGIGLFYAGIGYTNNLYWMLASAFALGLFNAIYNVSAPTYWQETIPLDQLGRFFGLISSVFSALGIIGMSLNGVVGTFYSPDLVLLVTGGVIAVIGFISIFMIALASRRMKPGIVEQSIEI